MKTPGLFERLRNLFSTPQPPATPASTGRTGEDPKPTSLGNWSTAQGDSPSRKTPTGLRAAWEAICDFFSSLFSRKSQAASAPPTSNSEVEDAHQNLNDVDLSSSLSPPSSPSPTVAGPHLPVTPLYFPFPQAPSETEKPAGIPGQIIPGGSGPYSPSGAANLLPLPTSEAPKSSVTLTQTGAELRMLLDKLQGLPGSEVEGWIKKMLEGALSSASANAQPNSPGLLGAGEAGKILAHASSPEVLAPVVNQLVQSGYSLEEAQQSAMTWARFTLLKGVLMNLKAYATAPASQSQQQQYSLTLDWNQSTLSAKALALDTDRLAQTLAQEVKSVLASLPPRDFNKFRE